MATTLNFPSSPNTNDTYSFGGKTWTYNGSAWKLNTTALTTTTIAEGSNLYFTNARSRAAISVSGSGSYDQNTGVITVTGGVTSVNGQTGAATGFATTANSLSQFASTSSSELATLISDETGTGNLVFSVSPALTGTPTAPTAANNVSTTQIATTEFVKNTVANLVDGAPALLDTLNELAAALNDDASFSATIANTISVAQTTAGNAFGQANTATLAASSAFGQANTATLAASAGFDKANTAYVAAVAAFDSANTKVTTVAGVTGTTISNAQIASGISSSGILTTANVSELTNLYFTNARSRGAISVTGAGTYDSSTGIINITGGVTSVGGATGAVSNAQLATSIITSGVLNTSNVAEGANLYFTTSRARASIDAAFGGPITYSSATGNVALSASGVTANTYGGASKVPVITVDAYGRITSASNVSVAGVSTFTASGNTFTIGTADGGSFSASIQPDSVTLGRDTTGNYVATMTAGNGITVGTATGEGSTPVITNTGVLSVNGQTGNATGFATTANSLAQFAATTSSELAGVISDETGSGNLVFSTSPTLVTPILGTPQSATLTNATGLPVATGISGLGTGVATFLSGPTSANLRSAVSDETGSGSLVFSDSPVLITPNIGTASYAVLTNATGLPISTGVSGLGTNVATFLATPSSANLAAAVTDETGTGNILFSNSPVMVTPNLGTPSAATLTNATGLPLTTGVTGTLPVANGGTGVTTSTGTGNVVLSTSPVLTTPDLGTPSAATLTNATGLPISTGVSGLGSGVATFLGQTPTSANLATLITDETGSGALVFGTSPTLVTPILGTPQSATLTNATGLPVSTGISGLASGVASFLATPSSANFATVITDETGTGNVVLSNSPVLVTPNVGTPSYINLVNATGLNISAITNGLDANVVTFLGQVSTSANLAALITDETGTGALVFGTSPAITTALTTPSGSFDLVNTTATTVNFAGAGTTVNIGAATGNTNILNNMVIAGNLLVQGTTTTVSSTTLDVADKNLTLAKGAGSSAGADGAGITIDGAGATLNYVHATTAFTSSQDVDLAAGKALKVAGTNVLNATGLGPNVVNSNLTSVGTISSGTWQGSVIGTAYTAAKVTSVNGQVGAATGFATTANALSQFAATTSAELAGVISDETGTGNVVFSTNPVLVTPNLGTPSAATLTNATGLPISTGVSGLGTGVATFLGATPTSANLATLITDETGSGALVFATSPVLVTPNLGTPSAATLTNATGLPVASGISGLGTGVATFLATPSSSNLASALTDETGTGNVVFSTSPVLTTPNLGTPSAATLTNATGLPIVAGTTGTLTVARGGTGVTTSTGSGNVVLSTSPVLTTPDLGTPSAATLTNATGLPISSGVSGLGANIATFLATPTSANFAFAVTDETGSGNVVLSNNPVLVTPNLGTPSAATLTNATGLPISTGVSGLGTNVATFLATPSSANLAGAVTDETGSGALVFGTSPTLVTPILGTPQSATLTNATGLPISTGVSGLGGNVATFLSGEAKTGVIATTYGSALNIPVITVDEYGRISSAANVALVSGVSSVGGATGAVSNAQLASAITSSGILTTANVAEVTNLYFTNARSRQSITAGTGITYDNSTGVISASGTYTDANARAALSITGTKGGYNSGTGVFDFANIANVTVSASAPGSPNIGDVWIDEDDGASYLYFNDGTSSQWVEQGGGTTISSLVESVGGSTGAISNVMLASALTGQTLNVANLTVTGTLTSIQSTNIDVTDKNITVAKGAANSAAADGAGITVDGANATFNYVHANTAWTSSQDLDLASGKAYEINGTSVLSNTTLGSGVTNSSLTSVGTIATGVWNGSSISTTYTDAKVTSVAGSTGAISNAMIASSLSGLDITVGNLTPTGNLIQSLGSPTNQFKDLYLSNSTIFLGSLQLKDTGGALTVSSAGGGGAVSYARTTDKLSAFAATTSSELAGVISDETGSGALVFATSPTLVTPALGTPSSATLTNATGLPVATGISGLGTGIATFLATPSSANLAAAVTDESGTGALLFAGGALGTPASGTLTNCTFPTLNQNTTGSAATLTTPRAINGVNFDGSAAITVTAAAGTLSGATLASGVTASSLTSVGTIATGVWQGTAIATTYGGTGNSVGYASGGAASAATSTVSDDTSTNSTHYIRFSASTSGNVAAKVSSTKLTFNPSTGLLTSTDYNSSSDKRLKKNIKTVNGALATVEALRGVTFEWNEGGAKSIGMIAQEVQEVIPDVVTTDDNGYMGIKYTNMVGVLVEAIKELKAEFEAYKKTHP